MGKKNKNKNPDGSNKKNFGGDEPPPKQADISAQAQPQLPRGPGGDERKPGPSQQQKLNIDKKDSKGSDQGSFRQQPKERPQDQSRSQQSRDQPRSQQPQQQAWGQQTSDQPRSQQHKQQAWGQQTSDQPRAQQPKEQALGQPTRDQSRGQQTRDQPRGQQTRDQPRGQQPKEQGWGQQTRDQPRAQQHKQQGWGQQTSDQPRAQQPKEQALGQQTRDQSRGQQPKEQGWGQQTRDQSRGQQSKEQTWGQQTKDQSRGQQTRDQSHGQQTRDQSRGQQPKQQGWGQQTRDQPRAQQPKEQGWGQQTRDQPRAQQPKEQAWGQHTRDQSGSQQSKDYSRTQQSRDQPYGQQQKEQFSRHESPKIQKSFGKEHGDAVRHEQSTDKMKSLSTNVSNLVVTCYGVDTKRGTRGRPIFLEVNYVKLIIDDIVSTAYQYDIKFDPDKPKRFLRPAFEEYCRVSNLPCKVAFDGRAIVFSPEKLNDSYCKQISLKVRDPDAESSIVKDINVTLTLTSIPEIQLNSLKSYHNNPVYDQPQRALQCVDVVLRSAYLNNGTRCGRSIYNKPPRRLDLEDGFEMWYGLFQSAVLGSQPLLNIDVCHRAFPSEQSIIQVCQNLSRYFDPRKSLDYKDSRALQGHLSLLKVIYDPPKCFNQDAKIYGFNKVLQDRADNQYFEGNDGKRMTVAKYFQERGYTLTYPNLPCLHIGPRQKTIYIPMELCRLPGGQVSSKKAGPNQVKNLIRYAAVSTTERKANIMQQFTRLNHNMDDTIKSFGIKVGNNFIQINGRILDSPRLQYGNKELSVRDGKWDSARDQADFIIPSQITFGILVMDQRFSVNDARDFGNSILKWGNIGNVNLNRSYEIFKVDGNQEQRTFENHMLKFKRDFKAHIVFVIIANIQQQYAKVKQWAELDYGVLTQCVKSITVQKRLNQSTVQNILLKVNAKTNGLNHKISRNSQTQIMANEDVMFIGADVTHPSPDQRDIPSIVGVAASHDVCGFQYNMQFRLQDPKQEMIDKMDEMVLMHLNIYKKFTKKLPKQILYYRDGVSDGQLPQVKDIELKGFDKAFKQAYGPEAKPKLTCLIVQKRHHTRFFPQQQNAFGKFKNVPPGTIVDQDITHPNECQFFLVSHESIQGTAKPTKYVVIRDDNKYNIDDLQAITNNMCHMFTRCNRAVSYPAPAYYAHLVAARGRVYTENSKINLRNLDRENKNRTIHNDIVSNYPMYFT